nr:uncharacterized protein LOC104120535 [Nicotiana tomentosiformis]
MPGLSTTIVWHQLPTDPARPPVKQKPGKFKHDLSLRIKEGVTKQIEANVVRVTNYTWKGLELDPSKIKAIQDLPLSKSKKDAMSFLGRLKYISRFIAQSMIIYEPIFKLLKKDAATEWTEECQKAFNKIKEYLPNPPVLVPPKPGKSLLLYLTVLDNAFGYVLGQHDETRRKEQAIYYMGKNEFGIVYVTQKAIKGQALVDHLAENPVDMDYELLTTYFPDEELLFVGEDIAETYPGWRMFLTELQTSKV